MSKNIPLTKGHFAVVDDDDYDWLMRWSWCLLRPRRDGASPYARRGETREGKSKTVLMHVQIMQPPVGFSVDHINGNGLDNQRSNLRLATHGQNMMNRGGFGSTSRFKGVYRLPSGRFLSIVTANNERHRLGTFREEEEAASAYNEAALRYFGEFAKLNHIQGAQ